MTVLLPHLETNVTLACDNRCVACNHFVPIQIGRPHAVTPDDLAVDLAHFGRVAHVERYALLGGEPTLHRQLVELLAVARASGVADRLEVWTNGQHLRRMSPAFWAALDILVVSAYPGKLTDADLDWIRQRAADAGVQVEIKDERGAPYFTRLLEPTPTGEAWTQRKYAQCWYRTYTRVLDHGWFYRCCTSPFIAPLLMGMEEGADGLRVEGLTEEALRAFLDQAEPANGCRLCAGHGAGAVAGGWREVRDPQQWVEASSR